MRKEKVWPEVFVETEFLDREDIINKVLRVDAETFHVNFEHEVLGQVVEIFNLVEGEDDGAPLLALKSIFPLDMQEEEELEVAKDYYNNFLLGGHDTYLEYFNEAVGYFLVSRNVREIHGAFD